MSPGQSELREARIAELEARLSRRVAWGVRPWVGAAAIAACAYFLFTLRLDLAYALSSRVPTVVGQEGDYRLGLLRTNTFVELRGLPGHRGLFFRESGRVRVVVSLLDAPLLVCRNALPGESWTGSTPPTPDATPFTVRGRLLSRADAPRYRQAFEKLQADGPAQWILLAGEAPGTDLTPLLLGTGLVVFAALNGFLLRVALVRG